MPIYLLSAPLNSGTLTAGAFCLRIGEPLVGLTWLIRTDEEVPMGQQKVNAHVRPVTACVAVVSALLLAPIADAVPASAEPVVWEPAITDVDRSDAIHGRHGHGGWHRGFHGGGHGRHGHGGWCVPWWGTWLGPLSTGSGS
ncbi:hypothetical protein GCM10023319_73640 [Nocardia iowensis]